MRSASPGGDPTETGLASLAVTVVVPVLNPESTSLRRALDSLRRQTFPDFEVVVVDDGSAEAGAREIDAIAVGDSRIAVIHQANAGVSAARNRGIHAARGEFVVFLDGDDYLDDAFLAEAVRIGRETTSDVVFGRIEVRTGATRVTWRVSGTMEGEVRLLSHEDIEAARGRALSASPSFDRTDSEVILTNVVGGLYRRSALSGVEFPPGVRHSEDRIFNVRVLGPCSRVALVNSTWYVYDRGGDSSVTTGFDASHIPELEPTLAALAHLGGFGPRGDKSAPPPLADAAAAAILNNLKAAALAAAGSWGNHGAAAVAGLARVDGVDEALRTSHAFSGADRVVARIARRSPRILLLLAMTRRRGARGTPRQEPPPSERGRR